MTAAAAREYLAELGYTPGLDSTADPRFAPDRDGIKAACAALAEEARRPAPMRPAARVPVVVKQPRKPEDVPTRDRKEP